jgi:hypothetical protein
MSPVRRHRAGHDGTLAGERGAAQGLFGSGPGSEVDGRHWCSFHVVPLAELLDNRLSITSKRA